MPLTHASLKVTQSLIFFLTPSLRLVGCSLFFSILQKQHIHSKYSGRISQKLEWYGLWIGFGRSSCQHALPFGNKAAKSLSDLCIPPVDQVMVYCSYLRIRDKDCLRPHGLDFGLGVDDSTRRGLWYLFSSQRCIARSEIGCLGAAINSDWLFLGVLFLMGEFFFSWLTKWWMLLAFAHGNRWEDYGQMGGTLLRWLWWVVIRVQTLAASPRRLYFLPHRENSFQGQRWSEAQGFERARTQQDTGYCTQLLHIHPHTSLQLIFCFYFLRASCVLGVSLKDILFICFIIAMGG